MSNNPIGVVDYDAWRRGYIPPSEHVLIDKLAFRGAKVVFSTMTSRKGQMWIVVEGDNDLMTTIDDLLEFSEFLLSRKKARQTAQPESVEQEQPTDERTQEHSDKDSG